MDLQTEITARDTLNALTRLFNALTDLTKLVIAKVQNDDVKSDARPKARG